MQTDFDVIIIGAGPAGAASAISLARRGYAVALIDKEEFPREKLCGDFINPSNWPMLAQRRKDDSGPMKTVGRGIANTRDTGHMKGFISR